MSEKDIKKEELDQEIAAEIAGDEEDMEEVQNSEKKDGEVADEENNQGEVSSEDESSQIEDLKSTLQRLQADFNNYRTRVNKEKMEMAKYAGERLVEKLLPVLDNFDRALKACEANKDVVEGFSLIDKQLEDILKAEGLEEIESTGIEFDPHIHMAVVTEESEEKEGIVLETLQKGYKFGDKVLRASMVKVSK